MPSRSGCTCSAGTTRSAKVSSTTVDAVVVRRVHGDVFGAGDVGRGRAGVGGRRLARSTGSA